ncbi:uncharacterized protein, partial [Zea mays]|uniref:uncharacterized protein n=1 Tax=Zea mays TaxID=4577 RepID=UPI001651B613
MVLLNVTVMVLSATRLSLMGLLPMHDQLVIEDKFDLHHHVDAEYVGISRQKSYADVRRRDLEFAVGDQVLLRVSPTKGVVRFGVSGKLSPRYIGPFTILARVGSLAYRLLLPDSMAGVHPVFHVSMLRKFLRDPDHQIEMEPIAVQQDLTLECRPVRILEFSERVLRKRSIKYVKVLWSNQSEREATWELEELMRQKYPE